MIAAVHTLVYADDPEAARAFFRDVLQWPHIDTGGGWLIFKTGPSELGVHPTSGEGWSTGMHHEISLVCDDLDSTITELTAKGAEFIGEIRDEGFGRAIQVKVPGAGPVLVYEPRYAPPAVSI